MGVLWYHGNSLVEQGEEEECGYEGIADPGDGGKNEHNV